MCTRAELCSESHPGEGASAAQSPSLAGFDAQPLVHLFVIVDKATEQLRYAQLHAGGESVEPAHTLPCELVLHRMLHFGARKVRRE